MEDKYGKQNKPFFIDFKKFYYYKNDRFLYLLGDKYAKV